MDSILKRAAFPALLCAALTACGGGEGAPPAPVATSPTPAPTPTPTPTAGVTGATDRIVYQATQAINFEDEGRYWTDGGLKVNYGANGFYYASSPMSSTPEVIGRAPGYTPQAGYPWQMFVTASGLNLTTLVNGQPDFAEFYRYLYSSLISWSIPLASKPQVGATAIGISTAMGAGPSAGTTVYRGPYLIYSEQMVSYEGELVRDGFEGVIELTFDADGNVGQATLLPRAGEEPVSIVSQHPAPLVWTKGSAQFVQRDPTDASSQNYPISGRFTGPAAEELIGGLRFQYVSKIDGKTYEARGAFVAKR